MRGEVDLLVVPPKLLFWTAGGTWQKPGVMWKHLMSAVALSMAPMAALSRKVMVFVVSQPIVAYGCTVVSAFRVIYY